MSSCRYLGPPILGPLAALGAATALTLTVGVGAVRADVVGRLHLIVTYDGKPVPGAKVTLTDPTNVRSQIVLTTDDKGQATTGLLENHAWTVSTETDQYQNDSRSVTVAADVTTDVEIKLHPIPTGKTVVRVGQNLVKTDNPTSATTRGQNFYKTIPVTAGNPQALTKAVLANPGFVQDSANQAHPRGEHSATSIYINGFLLPGALQGRAGAFLSTDAIQTMEAQTGAYAPEYGGETAAILNLTLRAGTVDPFVTGQLGGGGYDTFTGSLTAGGQFGAPTGGTDAHGDSAKKFSYLINASQYSTANALEPPQPDDQTAHNYGQSSTFFGNFAYSLNQTDSLGLVLNDAPARTEVANRTGLSDFYAPYGQGYGFGGAQTAGSTTTLPDGTTVPLLSQEQLGQDIYQVDNNGFGTLQYRRQFSPTVTGVFNLGYSGSQLDIRNDNPAQYRDPVVNPDTLAEDSSLEFSPTLSRDYSQAEFSAGVTMSPSLQHTLKFGGVFQSQHGDESYQFVPGSQLALDALYATDPRLAPGGGTLTGETDANGNPVYRLSGASATPTLRVKRNGYYGALYAQDTYRPIRRFTVNYGLRLDMYHQTQNLGQAAVNKTELSPRINTAYVIAPLTVLRLSYDHLFTQPPLAQGAIIGDSIQPQTSNLYEANVERQFGQNQTVKIAYYEKYSRHALDTGLLLPGTQIGALATVNFDRSTVKGTEVSYAVTPRGGVGMSGYLSWSNSVARPFGFTNTGEEAEAYADHDQRNSIGAGVAYTAANGVTGGIDYYYGSGLASSVLAEDLARHPHKQVNLRLASGNKLLKQGLGLELDVENLFDARDVINFASEFSGTRFMQGRRVLLSLNGKF